MTILDRAKSFFKREQKLTDAAIKRTKIDESICRDMRRRAEKLGERFEAPPTVRHGPGTYDLTGYPGWEDMLTDAFCAHAGLGEPQLTPENEMKPSAEMRRRTVQSYLQSDQFQKSRPQTRDDPLSSAFATLEAARVFEDAIENGELKEHAEREDEMRDLEDDIDELLAQLDLPEEDQHEKTEELLEQKQERLVAVAEEQDDSDLRQAAATVGRRAADAAEHGAEIASHLPGTGPGSQLQVSANDAFALAERWTRVEEMWELAKYLGRLQRSMAADRSTRAVGGHEELVGIERGNDLSRVLPSELMRMNHPLTRKSFYLDFFEEDLMQFASMGHLPRDRGSIITVKDGSSSMKGARFLAATSLALALVYIGHQEGRHTAVVEFGSTDEVVAWEFPAHEPIDAMRLCECAEHFFNGGTDCYTGLANAAQILKDEPSFESADIALVTDGEDEIRGEDLTLRDELHEMGVRILGVAIAQRSAEYLETMCDDMVHISDMDLTRPQNDASTFLAQSIS